MRSIRIGIDIGGTFTDLQIVDENTGHLYSLKTPTTPADPSLGLIQGIREAAQRFDFTLSDVRLLLHGTTIATNAVLERRLARGALITTAGFEDVLEIGRHARRNVYGLIMQREPALIPRDRRFGVTERMHARGGVAQALDAASVASAIQRLSVLDVETVAVMLLNAHINPEHEQAVAQQIRKELPHIPISISTDISPEIREYERVSTTVLNALLIPVVGRYLARLTQRLKDVGLNARLLLVQSNGGVCSAEVAAKQPARLLLSGPSGGALAALRTALALQRPNLVGVDMGGTSFDVCVIRDSQITSMTQGEIDGLPVRLPMVEIRTIGAGGGSIAAVDAGQRLTVGPRSAGAQPGPVCYRRGGEAPTVTDANLALGRLDADFFLGGTMKLDAAAAGRAIAEKIAAPLNLDPDRAAEGLLAVADASLAAAIRLSLFEKGLDPRSFSLLSFGGAGGLHAVSVAEELGVPEVIFPANASTFSAYGILQSDIVHDLARSRLMQAVPENLPAIAETCAALRTQGDALLAEDGVPQAARRLAISIDMRYRGQAFELVVPWGNVEPGPESFAQLLAEFHTLHLQRFSYANPDDSVEIVTFRLTATGLLPRSDVLNAPQTDTVVATKIRRIYLHGAWRDIAVHRWASVKAPVQGPALIEEDYTTVFIGQSWQCSLGDDGALIARRSGA